jgi:predicted metal-binding protein
MKMLVYEGAIFVSITVPLICKKCSPLNVKLLCFSTNVSNWTIHSVGGSLTALWSHAYRHASIPSLCGMLVYNDVTSIETRMVKGRFEDNQ